jgi:hypothetical protein
MNSRYFYCISTCRTESGKKKKENNEKEEKEKEVTIESVLPGVSRLQQSAPAASAATSATCVLLRGRKNY